MRVGLIQMNGSNIVQDNIDFAANHIKHAAAQNIDLVQLPEIANLVEKSSERLGEVLSDQASCPFLAAMQDLAHQHKIHIHIGSLALKNDLPPLAGQAQAQAVNRGFMLNDGGDILAQYDKIHMFDVTLPDGEQHYESKNYRAGSKQAIAKTSFGDYGLSICYDVRFAEHYRLMAQAGAMMLGVPAAFTQTTGRAHWHILLRARAIECSAFVFAAAQVGNHHDGRKTYGHSLIVDPWGRIITDAGSHIGLIAAEIDLNQAVKVRSMIPAWSIETVL